MQNKLGNFFKIKDPIPTSLRSNLIYKWQCGGCDATYVGKTTRSAWMRWFEHLGKSYRTGNYLSRPSYSAIREHSEETGHPLHIDDFSVLTTAQFATDLDILEVLYTIKIKPSLARNVAVTSLLCF